MKRPPKKPRNSLGRFLESSRGDDECPQDVRRQKLFMPPAWGKWKFRTYVKRGRRHFFADRGELGGRRVREWGDSLDKVKAKVAQREREIAQHGQLAKALTTAQRYEMARCLIICEPLGLTPLQACEQLVAQHPLGGRQRTVAQVVAEVIARKRAGNRREHYVDSLERSLLQFAELFPARGIHTVTTGELEDELARHPQWAPATVHGHVSNWKVLFNHARKHEYCFKNPCEAIDLPERDAPEPQIFTVNQVRAMFAHTLFSDRDPLLPCCQPYLALGIFAGIRPEEIERLEWEQIDLGTAAVTVLGSKSKVRQRRIVDLAPNALTWIAPWARRHGTVLRHPVAVLRIAIRTALGLAEWPHDVLRHSFGSYHFAFHRNESLVKNQMGHSDDGRMFFSHYRVLVTRSEASKFWRIARPAALLAA